MAVFRFTSEEERGDVRPASFAAATRAQRAPGQRAAAQRAAAQARSALFVCKGNICRSPFAAASARRSGLFEGTASAGHLDADGRIPPPAALDAARRRGIELTAHRSRRVDAALLDAADIVFVFDRDNRENLIRRFPRHLPKIYMLGLLERGGPAEMADPWGGDQQTFDTCYHRIEEALERIRELRAAVNQSARE